MVNRNGQAAIGDFGLSKPRSKEEGNGDRPRVSMAGTMGYLDPFWSHDQSYTASSDIYALGIVILQVALFWMDSVCCTRYLLSNNLNLLACQS